MAAAATHMQRRRKHLRIAERHKHERQRALRHGNHKSARSHLAVYRRHREAAQHELNLARRARKRRRAGSGPSGLSEDHRIIARKRAVQAAFLALNHRGVVHYTQGGSRWQGINAHLVAANGHYPNWADCSSLSTWCLWNGLAVPFGVRDIVNGCGWRAGYTGTLLNHGVRVTGTKLPGDLVIYGYGFPGHHVAIYVGDGRVVSHGSEAGPMLVNWRYRGDVQAIRRYI